jgi:hypothetical protein
VVSAKSIPETMTSSIFMVELAGLVMMIVAAGSFEPTGVFGKTRLVGEIANDGGS